ncbi:MAG: DUF6055 domain-containing protein [Candidatus Kapaibacterium sp.]
MQRSVVRFTTIVKSCLLTCVGAFLIAAISAPIYGQKSVPLSSQAQSVSQLETMVRSGLPLTHEDTILVAFGQMKGMFRSLPSFAAQFGKCGTELAFEANRIQQKFSKPIQEAVIQSVTTFTDSLKSPSGRFTIFYDKSGVNVATPEYVDSVARFADEAYQLEIVDLGNPKPPFSYTDSTWHIELIHLGAGFYGATYSIGNSFAHSPSGLSLFRAFIQMDNSFDTGYTTHGTDAARVTVFHEFQHVIQNGCYGKNLVIDDVAFREMTAVWMEMRSTPWVTDYLQYLSSYTLHLGDPFDHVLGIGYYGQCIWMQYLSKKFGDDIIKNVWEDYSRDTADYLSDFDSVLINRSTNFCDEYKRFGTAVYYTGRNFQGTSFFTDAKKFDADAVKRTVLEPNIANAFLAFPASVNIFTCGYGKDTSVIAISRSTDRSYVSNASVTSKSVLVFQDSFQFPDTFCDTISLPILIATKIFPQPFTVSPQGGQNTMSILAATNYYQPLNVNLTIYSMDNALIRHLERAKSTNQILAADPFGGSWYIQWDGRDDSGRLVPSGVYFYSIVVDGLRDNGKFVVIRKN